MKIKEIEVPFFSEQEESQEFKEKLEELRSFCKERGFLFWEGQYTEPELKGAKFLRITVEDQYNSEEMRKTKEYCKKKGWKRGAFLSNTSKNIFEAYQKANKEFLEANEKGTNTESDTENLLQLGNFRAFLKEQIFRKTMEQYSLLEEKVEKRKNERV